MEERKAKLDNKVKELKSKIEAIDKRNKERRDVEQKQREEEIEFRVTPGWLNRDGREVAQESYDLTVALPPDSWMRAAVACSGSCRRPTSTT